MDFITKLREPKIQIIDNLELSIFDVSVSYLGVYIISKYIFKLQRPGLTSAIIFMPISYLAHEYFEISTPFNDYINGKTEKKPDPGLVQPQVPLPPIDFETMNIATQMYIQQNTPSKDQVFDEKNNLMKPVPYQQLR